jgi:hypothetical protein
MKRYILPILLAFVVTIGGVIFGTQPTYASSQVIFASNSVTLNTAATARYNSISGGTNVAWALSGNICTQVVSTAGKIKSLYVELSADPNNGVGVQSYAFTLMVNGVASALTCTVSEGSTSANDIAHEIDVVAGDYVYIRCVATNTPTAATAQWTTLFTSMTAKESLLLGAGWAVTGVTRYIPVCQGSSNGFNATENNVRQVFPTGGIIKNLYIIQAATAGAGTYTYTLRVNGINSNDGAGNPLQVTIAHPNLTGNDIVHSIPIIAGDVVDVMEVGAGTTTSITVYTGMTFVAITDGESVILGGSSANLDTVNTMYNPLNDRVPSEVWNATETNVQQLAQVCVLKKLYVLLSGSPDTGVGVQSYIFTVESNTATATSITTTISEAATTGNDTINTATLVAGDNICLKSVPSASAPTARAAYWGMVCYIAPPVIGRSFGIIIGN